MKYLKSMYIFAFLIHIFYLIETYFWHNRYVIVIQVQSANNVYNAYFGKITLTARQVGSVQTKGATSIKVQKLVPLIRNRNAENYARQ